MPTKNNIDFRCTICGCLTHRNGMYAQPTPHGRSHATEHHYVAERFFGRSGNRPGDQREGAFKSCPWGVERQTSLLCYECHEELLHNPVLMADDLQIFGELVRVLKLNEDTKTESRELFAERIQLFHRIIRAGLHTIREDLASKP